MSDPVYGTGAPESFGWIRRPDLDANGGQAYERPDGTFYMFAPGQKPKLVRMKPQEGTP